MRNFRLFLVVLLSLSLLAVLPTVASAATFTVNTDRDEGELNADKGDGNCRSEFDSGGGRCTLRAAIEESNSTGAIDTINFNIPGGAAINVGNNQDDGNGGLPDNQDQPLPPVFERIIIDGCTQPGADCTGGPTTMPNALEVVIDGTNATIIPNLSNAIAGLRFTQSSDDSTVQGLVIQSFRDEGIEFLNSNSSRAFSNFLGTNRTGTTSSAVFTNGNSPINGTPVPTGVEISSSNNVTVGGPGNGQGNVIGSAIGGGTGGDEGFSHGVHLSADSDGAVIQGNHLGTNRAGTVALPLKSGVAVDAHFVPEPEDPDVEPINGPPGTGHLIGGTTGVTPGGDCTGACNLISGNSIDAIEFELGNQSAPATEEDVLIQGNFIGTDVTGTLAIPNEDGIFCGADMVCNIGGPTLAEGNLISGNTRFGIDFHQQIAPNSNCLGPCLDRNYGPNDSLIQNNVVGLSTTGAAAIPNGSGIRIEDSSDITLTDNTVNQNIEHGILVGDTGPSRSDNVIVNGNIIRNNGSGADSNIGAGVLVYGNAATTDTDIRNNNIFGSEGLAIDLAPGDMLSDGVTANDSDDPDTGPNNLQNWPTLTDVDDNGDGTYTVDYRLDTATGTYAIEFCSNTVLDPTGQGECEDPEDEIIVVAASVVTGQTTVNAPTGRRISASATRSNGANGETSEFSLEVDPDLTITKTSDAEFFQIGESATYTITVTNNGQGIADSVEVCDTPPVGLTFESATVPVTQPGNDICTNAGDLAGGDTFSFDITFQVNEDADTGTLINPVIAVSPDQIATPEDEDPIEVLAGPGLTIEKSVDQDVVSEGDEVEFEIVVTNNGDGTANSVELCDEFVEEFIYRDDDVDSSEDGQGRCADLGDIAPGEEVVAFFTFEAERNIREGDYLNIAEAQGSNTPRVEDDAEVEVIEEEEAEIDIKKKLTSSDNSKNQTRDFKIKVKNTGPIRALDVEMCDKLPKGTSLKSASRKRHNRNGKVCFDLGDIDRGDSKTTKLTLKVNNRNGKTLKNKAEADGSNVDEVRDDEKFKTPERDPNDPNNPSNPNDPDDPRIPEEDRPTTRATG